MNQSIENLAIRSASIKDPIKREEFREYNCNALYIKVALEEIRASIDKLNDRFRILLKHLNNFPVDGIFSSFLEDIQKDAIYYRKLETHTKNNWIKAEELRKNMFLKMIESE